MLRVESIKLRVLFNRLRLFAVGTCAPLHNRERMPRSRTAVKRHKVKVVRQTVKKKTRSVKEAVVGK